MSLGKKSKWKTLRKKASKKIQKKKKWFLIKKQSEIKTKDKKANGIKAWEKYFLVWLKK